MNLYSLSFLYLFLPLSVLVHHAVPKRAKNSILLLISLGFYAIVEPRYLPLLAASVLFDYAANLLQERFDNRPDIRRALTAVVLVKNTLMVLLLSAFTPNRELWRPLGVMICAVTSIGYTLDVYRRDVPCIHSLVDFALFCMLYVKLPAGPLVRWKEVRGQFRDRATSLEQMNDGLARYIRGLAKKILIGNNMTAVYDQLRGLSPQSMVSAWITVVSLAFAVYFNLSSLCDMAVGLGKMYGFDLPRNFDYPYQARSVSDFVERFNSTVMRFFRAYLPQPLNPLEPGSGASLVFYIAFSTVLWSIWFGFRYNFIIWGLYFVLFQLLEQLGIGTLLKKVPTLFARVYTFVVVMISFVIFSGDSVQQSLTYVSAMLRLNGEPLFTDMAMYVASSNYVLLPIALVLCTSVFHLGFQGLRGRLPRLSVWVDTGVSLVLLAVSTAFLAV